VYLCRNKKIMKNIFYILLSLFVLTSCVKYGEPVSLSLSGEYVIDKITYDNRDNQSQNQVFYPGDLYVNPSETKPIDSIQVGFTKMALDYSVIFFNPTNNVDGSTTWNKKFTYYVQGHNSLYEYGYIVFDYDGTRRVWKIIDDGVESLVIRTSGSYDYGSSSSGESTTMYLTRVGP
jgi:hypothetical protein